VLSYPGRRVVPISPFGADGAFGDCEDCGYVACRQHAVGAAESAFSGRFARRGRSWGHARGWLRAARVPGGRAGVLGSWQAHEAVDDFAAVRGREVAPFPAESVHEHQSPPGFRVVVGINQDGRFKG